MSGPEPDTDRTAAEYLFETIDDIADDLDRPGAPVGPVIDTVLNESPYGVGHICSTLQDLHANGELYQPADRTIKRTGFGEETTVADGGVAEDAEHHPDGFTSGDHHVLQDGLAGEPEPSIEDVCVDCSNEAFNHHCGCCRMSICGKHNEIQGGFCSRYFETAWAACVWPDDVYVVEMPDHEVLQTPGETDVFHVPNDPSDGDCTAPACRDAEDGKERVAMREIDDDAELCELCEQTIRAAAEDDGGDD